MGGVVLPGRGNRIGLLGGTFDPVHFGHLLLAQEAAWQLRLDRVLFLPARENPFKRGRKISAPEHRLAMLRMAVAEHPGDCFDVSTADLDRPPPSYTVDLLRALREDLGPACDLYFLSGGDVLASFEEWHEPEAVLDLATLVVANRPGAPPPDVPEFERRFPAARGRVRAIAMPGVDVSGSALRKRVAEGQPIRYLTLPVVEAYVREHGLYRGGEPAA